MSWRPHNRTPTEAVARMGKTTAVASKPVVTIEVSMANGTSLAPGRSRCAVEGISPKPKEDCRPTEGLAEACTI